MVTRVAGQVAVIAATAAIMMSLALAEAAATISIPRSATTLDRDGSFLLALTSEFKGKSMAPWFI